MGLPERGSADWVALVYAIGTAALVFGVLAVASAWLAGHKVTIVATRRVPADVRQFAPLTGDQ